MAFRIGSLASIARAAGRNRLLGPILKGRRRAAPRRCHAKDDVDAMATIICVELNAIKLTKAGERS